MTSISTVMDIVDVSSTFKYQQRNKLIGTGFKMFVPSTNAKQNKNRNIKQTINQTINDLKKIDKSMKCQYTKYEKIVKSRIFIDFIDMDNINDNNPMKDYLIMDSNNKTHIEVNEYLLNNSQSINTKDIYDLNNKQEYKLFQYHFCQYLQDTNNMNLVQSKIAKKEIKKEQKLLKKMLNFPNQIKKEMYQQPIKSLDVLYDDCDHYDWEDYEYKTQQEELDALDDIINGIVYDDIKQTEFEKKEKQKAKGKQYMKPIDFDIFTMEYMKDLIDLDVFTLPEMDWLIRMIDNDKRTCQSGQTNITDTKCTKRNGNTNLQQTQLKSKSKSIIEPSNQILSPITFDYVAYFNSSSDEIIIGSVKSPKFENKTGHFPKHSGEFIIFNDDYDEDDTDEYDYADDSDHVIESNLSSSDSDNDQGKRLL